MSGGEKEKTVIIGVTGGIACYKAVELVRLLVKDSLAVQVIMTRAAMEFVTPLTFQTLSGKPVATETFNLTQESEIGHINLADSADLFVIAPATANVIGKFANGIADDLLTTVLMATQAPVLIAPAMNVHMYENPILQENLRKLRRLGYHVMEPAEGFLACGYEGKGRLPDAEKIAEAIGGLLKKRDLGSEKLLITAGPSREPLDPVRYISNRSSGKMGYALARAALRRGAQVTLISGPTQLTPPPGAVFVPVQTAEDMREAVLQHLGAATVVIKAAAVAYYRAKHPAAAKIKGKRDLTIELTPNPDILAEVAGGGTGAFIVGFAAETHDVAENARAKLESKGIDLLVANDVSQQGIGFDADENEVLLLDRWGGTRALPRMPKTDVADAILSHILALRAAATPKKAVR